MKGSHVGQNIQIVTFGNILKKWDQSKKYCMWIANRNIGHCRLVVLAINFHPTMQYAAIASSISKNYEEKKKRE
jgi:hypothetical protein